MAKPVKRTYTMDMYLNKIKDSDIRLEQDVQRMSGQWDKSMINELVVTVLTDNYIPPIILGEELNSQLWIIDGLQRSSSLQLFRYGNYKVTSAIEQSVVPYRTKARDENGNIRMDENGDIIWEDTVFDIRNKTYDDLPDELKKKFNEYQIETVIHEACDMKQISKFVRRYNNHTAMKPAQKAFTYIDNYARDIRNISNSGFFIECVKFNEKERINGTLERVIMETVMCMFHFDKWKKQSKRIGAYLNEYATKEEFDILNHDLQRLEKIITEDLRGIFTSKDSFIWISLFQKFTETGLADRKFADFLKAFQEGLNTKEVNGVTFEELDKNRSTKDKSVISEKLNILETLMDEFLDIRKEEVGKAEVGKAESGKAELGKAESGKAESGKAELRSAESEQEGVLEFVKENIKPDATEDDMGFYEDMLNDWTVEVDNSSPLLSEPNHLSMIGIVAYAIEQEVDLVDWMTHFFKHHNSYMANQKKNYLYMKKDLNMFVK